MNSGTLLESVSMVITPSSACHRTSEEAVFRTCRETDGIPDYYPLYRDDSHDDK